jgi:hypothetical protein
MTNVQQSPDCISHMGKDVITLGIGKLIQPKDGSVKNVDVNSFDTAFRVFTSDVYDILLSTIYTRLIPMYMVRTEESLHDICFDIVLSCYALLETEESQRVLDELGMKSEAHLIQDGAKSLHTQWTSNMERYVDEICSDYVDHMCNMMLNKNVFIDKNALHI